MGKVDDFLKSGKLKKANFPAEMVGKELSIGKKDLAAAKDSFKLENYKWATIQSYYGIFHAVRALLFKAGYREESHTALKAALKELYIDTQLIATKVYQVFERGLDLRELADYKETFSKVGAESLINGVEEAILLIDEYLSA
jgi:uncharacterized protein (UPF0332 family)